MITSIAGSGKYLDVGNSPQPYVSNNGPLAGQIRFNTTTQAIEVYDGATWVHASMAANITLSAEAIELLNWVRKKYDEELQLNLLAEQNPGLKDAWEKFEIMKTLCIKQAELSK